MMGGEAHKFSASTKNSIGVASDGLGSHSHKYPKSTFPKAMTRMRQLNAIKKNNKPPSLGLRVKTRKIALRPITTASHRGDKS